MSEPRKTFSGKKVISPNEAKEMINEVPRHSEKKYDVADITKDKLIEIFIESNLSLQHKIADLVIEMKSLNNNVKSMVALFTEAGEHIKKGKYEEPLMVKLDDLLEQNKNIAKGLLLLEKFVREKQAMQTAFAPRPFQKQEGQ